MRIIGGKFKGKKLEFLKNPATRPLKDSVKENIFNILEHSNKINIQIENSKVLDLYSGIGSFGIECISRGASEVTFVERDKFALNILENNLTCLSALGKAKIIKENIEKSFSILLKKKFNIFFLDPPFSDINFIKNLRAIKQKKIFNKKHIVIVHRERGTKDNFENIIDIMEVKKYGRSKILFCLFN